MASVLLSSGLLTPLLTLCALINPIAASEENAIVNGDFERGVGTGPPPGWTMWGAQQDKVPAHFTRDTTQPHGGAACLRIHHPAGTAGYIVTAPEAALRPREGLRYVVSFSARADRPGRARFGWTAYRQIQPFVDAPAPGSSTLELDTTWRPFHFTVDEGWDFFADESRYLMLTFHAATDRADEQTLWIDDVVITAEKSPRPGRLVNPATLIYDHLAQHLQPGDRLVLTVDASRKLREAPARSAVFRSIASPAGPSCRTTGRAATCCRPDWRTPSARCTCR